jgi:hypothetical protein
MFVALILTSILILAPENAAWAQPELDFLDESVKLTLDRRKDGTPERCPPQTGEDIRVSTANATVFVLLGGSDKELTDLTFHAEVKPEKGKWGDEPSSDEIAKSSVDVCWAELKGNELGETDSADNSELKSTIEASQIKPFVIFVEGHTPAKSLWWWVCWFVRPAGIPIDEANLTGHLIVKDAASEEVVQGTLPLRLSNVAPGYEGTWFYTLMVISLIGFALAALSICAGVGGIPRTGKRDDLQFKDRWVANLTGAGAILGTILSAGVLPNDTFFMFKQQYLALNVLFGLIILLATVLSNMVGTARAFWLASAAVIGAGVGEVITILFILKEMQFQGSMPGGGVLATQITLLLASPFIIFFARRNMIGEIRKFPSLP